MMYVSMYLCQPVNLTSPIVNKITHVHMLQPRSTYGSRKSICNNSRHLVAILTLALYEILFLFGHMTNIINNAFIESNDSIHYSDPLI